MKLLKRIVLTTLLFASAAIAFGAPQKDVGKGNASAPSYELVVLHTNDHHGTTVAKDGAMGLAERSTFVKSVKAEHKNVLILDAGDINTGTALSNMFDAEPDIMAYNMMGYRAVAFGNHEFDKPLTTLEKQMKEAQFDFISANIKRADGSYLGKPYVIQEYPGFKVGIVGLTTDRTLVVASPDKSLAFLPEIEAAKTAVFDLRNKEKVDFVIIVGHLGTVAEVEGQTTSQALAAALHESGLDADLIIDGHSHSKFDTPLFIYNTPIVSAWEWGKEMGEALITIKGSERASFEWRPVEITTKAFPPDAAVTTMLAPYIEKANASLKQVVMKTTAEFPFNEGKITRLTRYKETALGDFVCDAYMWYIGANFPKLTSDFAITNGGGIRAALPAGDVTLENIKTVLPFDNWVYVVTLPGAKVKELFDFIPTLNQGAGAFPQVSKEVKYTLTYDAEGKNGKISDVTIGGKAIDPNKTYTIVTNDYMAKGGDGYTTLVTPDVLNTSMWLADVVVDYAKTLKSAVSPATDGRITVIGGVQP